MAAWQHGAHGTSAGAVLVVRAGGRRAALPVAGVSEVARPLPTTALPDAPPWVCGAAVIRGQPAPVIDLRRLLGWDDRAPVRRHVASKGERPVLIAVEGVEGVVRFPAERRKDLPPLLRAAPEHDLVRGLLLEEESLVVLIGGAMRVPDAVWDAVVAGEA